MIRKLTTLVAVATALFASSTSMPRLPRVPNPFLTFILEKPTRHTPNARSPDQVFWGDTHLHTALSPDAGLFGNTLGLKRLTASIAARKWFHPPVYRCAWPGRWIGWSLRITRT